MKNLLKKLHIVPSHSEDGEASPSPSSSPIRVCPSATGAKAPHSQPEQKPLSGLSNWLNSVSGRQAITPPSSSSSSSSSFAIGQRVDQRELPSAVSLVASEVLSNAPAEDSESSKPRDQEMDEELQIQLALELSAREDPEAAQIEAVKQISLGSCPPENSPAEILSYRYWSYNVLDYDDKILDGFYDLYPASIGSTFSEMPSLMHLQQIPISDDVDWEAALVNKKEDADLSKLEQKVFLMAKKLGADSSDSSGGLLVQKVAFLVAHYMGGKVCDPESMLNSYQNLRHYLISTTGSIVLPLGHLTVGLARHRALMFKVLADSLGISCRLMKGKQYTGSDDGALATVKLNDGRDYIVDLMSEPGTLIATDSIGLIDEPEEATVTIQSFTRLSNETGTALSSSRVANSADCSTENEPFIKQDSMSNCQKDPNSARVNPCDLSHQNNRHMQADMNNPAKSSTILNVAMSKTPDTSGNSKHPRSPSWTEGISSSTVQRMKLKNVSEYMINAAKENPKLAQKLQDVLLESGVAAPPNLFTEICTPEIEDPLAEEMHSIEDKDMRKITKHELKQKIETGCCRGPFLPQLPSHMLHQKVVLSRSQIDATKSADRFNLSRKLDSREAINNPVYEVSVESSLQESPLQLVRHMPVSAAAAAATAAVVASSMVVAAAKTNADMNLEVPVAAAATATAAAVVATTAAVSKQYEHLEPCSRMQCISGGNDPNLTQKNEVISVNEQQASCHGNDEVNTKERSGDSHQQMDCTSDKSIGTESTKSENALQDVVEFEIIWEDIILGERIGLGSFGEVYHGDWHGTEVAVKRFLHQDISSDALDEFISEVRIMKRLRHPNVVLFMGAVTRVPNLSIVTEFLHRGSLFRLIHRPNNQLDERRRLRMALDIARGMNYLHNCTPVIVHRDLKSPNLLVDKNWVVKVCDFGLSRIKHNTFLSSRSTAGTAEWMAPEVLRNEPSDEKCDVFSFGVILWELCTLQQPWEGLNPMQVVGAVGFQDRCLDIPDDIDPVIAGIIKKCWQINPKMRPSFSEIMAALRPLQKPMSSNQGLRQKRQVADSSEKAVL